MFLSCKRQAPDSATVSADKELLSRLRTNAVETLTIGTDSFVLETYLWCDLQPVTGDGKHMNAINRLVGMDSVKIPDNIDLVQQYVIYNDSVWISGYEDGECPEQAEYVLEKISRNGPGWGPLVDVISQVYDSKTKKNYYIKYRDVFVERID